jgi:peptidoglycan/xylan/chitin deacetylase (PgdA/CDA1 family)
VLVYHSINPRKSSVCQTPESFEEHMQWISDHCTVIPFGRAVEEAATHSDRNRPAVAVTFDDGYSDNYVHAFPTLVRYKIPATFFLTSGLLQGERAVVDRLRRAAWDGTEPALSWTQIQEMRAGGMEFGAHTHNHVNLGRLDDDAARFELSTPKDFLEDRLQERVTSVAYPFGIPRQHFSQRTMELAASVGYEQGAAVLFRSVRPSDRPLSIPRFPINNESVDMLQAMIFGKLDLIGTWQERAPVWAARYMSSYST